MVQKKKNYIYQFKLLFYLSWICLYLVYPTWISLHSVLQAKGLSHLSDPFARSLGILGLIIYFSLSLYLIHRYFSTLVLDRPVISEFSGWFVKIKDNRWLVIVCCLSVILHIRSFSLVEVGYLSQSLWLYDFSNTYWHRLFDFPIQYGFWSLLVLSVLVIKQKKMINSLSNYINTKYTLYWPNNAVKFSFIFIMFGFFSMYSYLFPYSWQESVQLLRFPPVAKLFYLVTHYAFGVTQTGPRIVQFIFYILSAVYLYRTIYLFDKKETALLGATIYLFSPIIFHYASFTFFASGTVFFMVVISFYFLKFIKDEDNRALILTAYFIGTGFMYKRVILVMVIICFAYLVFNRIKKRDRYPIIYFKILLLSLISVLPFMIIGRSSGLNYYYPIWSRLISLDDLMVYSLMIESQISLIILILFFISYVVILLIERDHLSLFFGLFFITYYLFITIPKNSEVNHRYAMALYPSIAVFLARFMSGITQRVRWKHAFKLTSSILALYLIFLCLSPRSVSSLITFKYRDFESQRYPVSEATDWIRDRTNDNERILIIMPVYYMLYLDRFYPDKDKINHERLIHYRPNMNGESMYSFEDLKEYCFKEKISYILFPFGPNNSVPDLGASKVVKSLKENSNNAFMQAAKFNYEDNYIYIYKLKEISLNHKKR